LGAERSWADPIRLSQKSYRPLICRPLERNDKVTVVELPSHASNLV